MAIADQLVQAKNNALGTKLTANLPNVKQQAPDQFQNNNAQALSNTNYQNITPNIDVSGYKNTLSNALTNSKYHDITTNTVGMDNTPYVNQINNAVSSANPSGYQNAVQSALNKYNGVNTTSGPSLQDIYNNSKDATQYYSDLQKYYPQQYNQVRSLQQQAQNAVVNGQDTSGLKQQYQGVINSGKAQQNAVQSNIYTPQDNASFESDMTNRINNLYDTQKSNVGLYYQTGIDQAKQQYAGLRDQASVGSQQSQNKLKEAMAQQGLFNSGDNITAQSGINNQYQNDLTGYNQQEQNYYNTTNNQIAQQKANYDAQLSQALIDLGYKADDRSFKMANLLDTRNQNTFNNSMVGINAQYGMNQDQFNNTLKGTTTTYGMGRDNVSDQKYNNDTAMQADQINYGRNQDYFNNTLKTIAQQYGMDEDQFNNLLKSAQFNSGEDQRQYTNSVGANQSNYDMYNNTIHNDQSQQQISNQNNQWQKNFDNSNNQWQQQFDYQKQKDALAQALAQAKASSGGSGSGGGRRSSGRSSGGSSESDLSQIDSFARDSSLGIGERLKALDGYANNTSHSEESRRNAAEYKQMLIDGMHYDNV